jgi:hypothetical protein
MSNESHGESDETPTESKTTGTVGNFPHGSRETPVTSGSSMEADRSEKHGIQEVVISSVFHFVFFLSKLNVRTYHRNLKGSVPTSF